MEKKIVTWLGLALAGVGVPLVGSAAFHDWALQHPLPAVGILVGYEVLLVLAGLARDVWGEQRPLLLSWLNLRVTWVFSRYYWEYRRYLRIRYRDLDVKGAGVRGPFTLGLEEVFIGLRMAPELPEKANRNPVPKKYERLREGQHSIWDYLHGYQHLAILGAPGSGKTTLLQHIALTLLNRKRRHKVKAPPKLPILLALREHRQTIMRNPKITLAALVQTHLAQQQHPAPKGWFEHQLKRGRCLVLLDGLDEVVDEQERQQVVHWVETQLDSYERTRFLLTSRPFGYPKGRLGRVDVLEVRPFTSEQVTQFITVWYLVVEARSAQKKNDDPGVILTATLGSQELLRKLQGIPELQELAVNPMLLTMLATVHRFYGALPGSRVELYAKACEVFVGSRQLAKDIPLELRPAQIQGVLKPLAFYLMSNFKQEISAAETQAVIAEPLARVNPQMKVADFLKLVEETSGLLLEQASEVYRFAHLTFQEYLAAVHVKEQGLVQELLNAVSDVWWHETIRLYVAQADATAIIQACLTVQPPSAMALSLALECLEEAQGVEKHVRGQMQRLLEQGVEDEDPERRRIVADALLTRRLRRQMIRLDEDRYVTTSLITCAEYQLFLDELRRRGAWHSPDHWVAERFPKGQGYTPVVGVRPLNAVAFCEWLTAREAGDWRYRLPRAGEIIQTQPDQALATAMQHGMGYWSSEGIEFLKNVSVQRFITWDMLLKQIAEDGALDHAPVHVPDGTLARALDLDRARDRILPHTITHTRIRPLARVNIRVLDLTLDLDLVHDRVLARSLTHGVTHTFDLDLRRVHAFTRVLDLHTISTEKEAAQTLRWLIRLVAFVLAQMLLWEIEHPNQQTQRKKRFLFFCKARHPDATNLQKTASAYLALCAEYSTVDARIKGELQPFEGILLVKELKQPGQQT